MRKLLNKVLSIFKKEENLDDIEPIDSEMNFECTPGGITVEKVVLPMSTYIEPQMFYYNRLFSRFNGLVLFDSQFLHLTVVAKGFNRDNRIESAREVLSLLDNPPEDLKILTLSPEEYERMKTNGLPINGFSNPEK